MTTKPLYFTAQRRKPRGVMFCATYERGESAYFVVPLHGSSERATAAAQERQRSGELPDGLIVGVKRVR